ncbi:MAG: hypothetical protein ACOYUZ_00940 [Patescibacteria group bacterium]
MPKNPKKNFLVKHHCTPCDLFAGIGIGLLVIFIGVILYGIFLAPKKVTPELPKNTKPAALGEEGATCGGELRLPCKPGNTCKITDYAQGLGVCVKVNDNPGPTVPGGNN